MKDDRVYLQHIRDALQDIAEYCGSDHRAFLDDRMRQDATLRKLEIIEQAVKNRSEDTRSRRSEIPWRQIAGMRDKVIHDYEDLSHRRLLRLGLPVLDERDRRSGAVQSHLPLSPTSTVGVQSAIA